MKDRIIALVATYNDKGEMLLLKRSEDAHCGGLWSLPGGKTEAGETPLQAAMRELMEETGMAGEDWRHLGRTSHRYPDRSLAFELFACICPDLSELHTESPYAWVLPEGLGDYPMPEANRKLLPLLGHLS